MKRVVLILLLLVLSACSSPAPTTLSGQDGTQSEDYPYPAGYPAPFEVFTETQPGYPAPSPTVEPSPTPDSTKGQVKGQILLKGQPVTHGILYLSDVIKDEKGQEIVVSFDGYSPNRSTMDENGNFYMANVPPGRYGIVFDLVSNSFLLMHPEREESLIVTVGPNEVLDLGTLNYSDLPNE